MACLKKRDTLRQIALHNNYLRQEVRTVARFLPLMSVCPRKEGALGRWEEKQRPLEGGAPWGRVGWGVDLPPAWEIYIFFFNEKRFLF